MANAPTLLETLQSLIERTYRMDTGIREIHRHVVGDRGLRRLYHGATVVRAVHSRAWAGAQVLVRQAADGVRANIYYPDDLIAALERHNPLRGLDGRNLVAFAVFVEELDHLLTLADRAGRGRSTSLFELELHANVTKHVACRHFLERTIGRPLDRGEQGELRDVLFAQLVPAPAPAEVEARYRDADRLGLRYGRYLDRLRPRPRLEELRVFHRLPASAAVRRVGAISASATGLDWTYGGP